MVLATRKKASSLPLLYKNAEGNTIGIQQNRMEKG
jgi:hypothetical protein